MATIEEDYVSFETAKLLKEKGFDQNCATYYLDGQVWRHYHGEVIPKYKQIYAAPTQTMAMKWLRKIHKIDIAVYPYGDYSSENYQFDVYENRYLMVSKDDGYMTYEQACEAAIKYCLENLI